MRRLAVLAAALAALPFSAQAADYAWPVVRVIDGDTIVVDASADLPPQLAEVRVRLPGVDAPEAGARAGCDAEREAAERATAFVEKLFGAAVSVVVRDPEWGKWGGRVVADIELDGKYSLAELVVDYGHARAAGGTLARLGWCEDEAQPEAATERTHEAAVQDLVDDMLASLDRDERRETGNVAGAAPAGPFDLQAEMERHILDPCLAASIRSGTLPGAERVAGMDEAEALATLKTIALPQVLRLAPMARPLMAGRPWPIREKFYDLMLDICLADFGGAAP